MILLRVLLVVVLLLAAVFINTAAPSYGAAFAYVVGLVSGAIICLGYDH